tara:strand:- start:3287 stop:3541 length:255 start_codon:yes stop_codon:yes gene_type:complete
LDEAVAAYTDAIRLDSAHTAAYHNPDPAYFALGRPGLAVDDYTGQRLQNGYRRVKGPLRGSQKCCGVGVLRIKGQNGLGAVPHN